MLTPEKCQVSDHQGINLGQADDSRTSQAAKGIAVIKKQICVWKKNRSPISVSPFSKKEAFSIHLMS